MRPVYVAGVGMTRFGKHLDRSLKSLAVEAVQAAAADAGIDLAAVEAIYSGNSMAGILQGQECIRGQVMLADLGVGGLPLINVENACATSATAFHLAWQAVAGGFCDLALVLGSEKMYHTDRSRTYAALAAAADVEAISAAGGNLFMEIYAEKANKYAIRSGATPADYSLVAVKNRRHAAANPFAQYTQPTSVAEVIASPEVVAPLTRLMCSPIADGAAACVLMSEAAAARHGRRRVRVGASVVAGGIFQDGAEHCEARAVRGAYAAAGLGPQDLNVVELHDATAPAELERYEDLGLCGPNDGPRLLRDGETALGGRIPVNTGGGLLSRGHPVGATGLAQLVELTLQLRGQAGARQVTGARVALAHNAGGWTGVDAAAAAVHILHV